MGRNEFSFHLAYCATIRRPVGYVIYTNQNASFRPSVSSDRESDRPIGSGQRSGRVHFTALTVRRRDRNDQSFRETP
jgi:hypothetical protein